MNLKPESLKALRLDQHSSSLKLFTTCRNSVCPCLSPSTSNNSVEMDAEEMSESESVLVRKQVHHVQEESGTTNTTTYCNTECVATTYTRTATLATQGPPCLAITSDSVDSCLLRLPKVCAGKDTWTRRARSEHQSRNPRNTPQLP